MKIAVVTSTFPKNFFDNVPKFVETQVINLKTNFPNLEFYILAPQNNSRETSLNTKYYKQIRFNYFWPKHFQKLTNNGIINQLKQNILYYIMVPFFVFAELFALIRLVKQEDIDFIYAHWFFPQAVNAYIVSKILKVPFSFTSHSSDLVIVDKKIPFLGKSIIRKVCMSAKSISTPSEKIMSLIKKYFSDEEFKKIDHHVIPMGINSNNISLDTKKNNDKSVFEILFVGRFSEKKGVDVLIESINFLLQKSISKKIKLKLAGEGEEEKRYKHIIKKFDLDNVVQFVGYLNEKDKYKAIQAADLIVVPSIESSTGDIEGLPVVVLEGLYCQTAVLASEYTNANEIIEDSINGFIVKNINPYDLAKKLFEIINLDPKIIQEIINEGSSTVKEFSSRKNSENFYKFLI
tara:strand:- start:1220 stop:2434 length:1215 start_codon:yes stop_codon:yes gene_type:complete